MYICDHAWRKYCNFYFTNRIFIFIKIMYNSVIRQAENDFDVGLHYFFFYFFFVLFFVVVVVVVFFLFGLRDIGLT